MFLDDVADMLLLLFVDSVFLRLTSMN